jgi:uncharacterized protein (DUF736 family)
MGLEEGEVIQHSMMTKSIERAQKKVEENNFGIRKRLLEYDDVMNAQREVIYKRRRHALNGERLQLDIANMMFDLEFMLIENSYKSEETHPDYRIEVSSPRGAPIRVGSAWMAKSSRTGNDYLSLLINTPDGDLRVNAVQNEEQRGGQTFSIIPFIDSGEQPQDAGAGLSLVA